MRLSGLSIDYGTENHVLVKHGITREQVDRSFYDPFRCIHPARGTRKRLLGRDEVSGRNLLLVSYIAMNEFRLVTCRTMTRKEERLYRTRRKERHG